MYSIRDITRPHNSVTLSSGIVKEMGLITTYYNTILSAIFRDRFDKNKTPYTHPAIVVDYNGSPAAVLIYDEQLRDIKCYSPFNDKLMCVISQNSLQIFHDESYIEQIKQLGISIYSNTSSTKKQNIYCLSLLHHNLVRDDVDKILAWSGTDQEDTEHGLLARAVRGYGNVLMTNEETVVEREELTRTVINEVAYKAILKARREAVNLMEAELLIGYVDAEYYLFNPMYHHLSKYCGLQDAPKEISKLGLDTALDIVTDPVKLKDLLVCASIPFYKKANTDQGGILHTIKYDALPAIKRTSSSFIVDLTLELGVVDYI